MCDRPALELNPCNVHKTKANYSYHKENGEERLAIWCDECKFIMTVPAESSKATDFLVELWNRVNRPKPTKMSRPPYRRRPALKSNFRRSSAQT